MPILEDSGFMRYISSPLSRRLVLLISSIVLLFFLLTTVIFIIISYNRGIIYAEESLELINKSYLPSITNSLYNIDDKQLKNNLKGILILEVVSYVSVSDKSLNRKFEEGDKSLATMKIAVFPLIYSEENRPDLVLGKLTVHVSYSYIYNRIFSNSLVSILIGLIEMFMIALVVLVVLHRTVLKYLIEFSDNVTTTYLENLDTPLVLSKKTGRYKDEIDKLVDSFNGMKERIRSSFHERDAAEQSLAQSENKYSVMVNNSTDIIFQLEQNGLIGFISPSISRYGYTPVELVGTPVLDVIHPDDREKAMSLMDIHKSAGSRISALELRLFVDDRKESKSNSDSPVFLVDAEVLYSQEEGKQKQYSGILGIAKDISERLLLEEQLLKSQKMEAIGTLTGGIAHDFNNIIQVINGSAELLSMKLEGNKETKYIDNIRSSCHSAAQLTRQLLTFSRSAASNKKSIDINKAVTNAVKLLEHTIPRMITINVDLANEMKKVYADPVQLEQVLLNISLNARDAIENNMGEITLKSFMHLVEENMTYQSLTLTPGSYGCISISDTGKGMEKEVASRIFEPFFTTKEVGKGTGLGLSMVYGIMKSHRGDVTCSSIPGNGTVFTLYFPTAGIETNTINVNDHEDLKFDEKKTVLLVDDEKNIREVTSIQLKNAGLNILIASSGEEALEVYKANQGNIDVVIMDLNMPGMGGKNAIKTILSIDSGQNIIIASGYIDDREKQDISWSDTLVMVEKPYTAKSILTAIKKMPVSRKG